MIILVDGNLFKQRICLDTMDEITLLVIKGSQNQIDDNTDQSLKQNNQTITAVGEMILESIHFLKTINVLALSENYQRFAMFSLSSLLSLPPVCICVSLSLSPNVINLLKLWCKHNI